MPDRVVTFALSPADAARIDALVAEVRALRDDLALRLPTRSVVMRLDSPASMPPEDSRDARSAGAAE